VAEVVTLAVEADSPVEEEASLVVAEATDFNKK
jgi:hypothetical protein